MKLSPGGRDDSATAVPEWTLLPPSPGEILKPEHEVVMPSSASTRRFYKSLVSRIRHTDNRPDPSRRIVCMADWQSLTTEGAVDLCREMTNLIRLYSIRAGYHEAGEQGRRESLIPRGRNKVPARVQTVPCDVQRTSGQDTREHGCIANRHSAVVRSMTGTPKNLADTP